MYSIVQHGEGDDPNTRLASPWMTALLGDAIIRYYILTEDDAALVSLSRRGDYLVNHGVYTVPSDSTDIHLRGYTFPHYLS